jgi:hypothetical protein
MLCNKVHKKAAQQQQYGPSIFLSVLILHGLLLFLRELQFLIQQQPGWFPLAVTA